MAKFFTLTAGPDTFTGDAGDDNAFQFTPTTLTADDTVTGGATGSFVDILIATAGGTITAAQLAHVSEIEQLTLAAAGTLITLTDGLVSNSSTGQFTVVDSGGDDTVDGSSLASTVPLVFLAGAGADTFKGGAGNDAFVIAAADLTSADTLQGGQGSDNIYFTTAGTVAAGALDNVTGIEGVNLNAGGNSVSLSDAAVASATGSFTVSGGAGNDTVDATAVTNATNPAIPLVFLAGTGADTFLGRTGANGRNTALVFGDLTNLDTVQGGTGIDNLYLGQAGTYGAAEFTNVINIEGLVLAAGTNNVTLTSGMASGSTLNYLAVATSTGNNTVNASGLASVVAFLACGGTDTFTGGSANDAFTFAAADLTSADTVDGGSGTDNLFFTTSGAIAATALDNVSGIEALVLNAGGNTGVTFGNGTIAGTALGWFVVAGGAGSDGVDASAVSNGIAIAFYGGGAGDDTFTGGNGDDSFYVAAAELDASDTITGGGGNDTLQITTNGTLTTAQIAGVTGIEGVLLQSGGTFAFADTLTAGTTFAGVGSSAVDTFDGSAVTAYGLTLVGNGGADALTGGTQNDSFIVPDSAFASISGNGGLDRILLATAGQTFDLTANASKITNTEIVDLTASAGASVTLAAADIGQVSAAQDLLYVVGAADDQVSAGSGWSLVSTTHTNSAVAAGVTFNEYDSIASGSKLFVANQINLTITVDNQPTTDAVTVSGSEDPTSPDYIAITITGTDPDGGDNVASFRLSNLPSAAQGVLYTDAALTTAVVSGTDYAATSNALALYFKPAANFNGAVTFQAAAKDSFGLADATPDTQTINVSAVNDAPVNAVPGAQTFDEDTTRTFNSANGNLISISDVDAAGNSVEVTLASTQGVMTLSGTTGLSFTTGDGTSDANMKFTGAIADINAALAGLAYTPTANYSGAAQISLTTDDKGNSGSGGAKTDTDVIALTITAVNDAPIVDLDSTTGGVQTSATTAAFTENGAALTILPDLTLSDLDSTTLAGATVTLTNSAGAEDVISLSGEGSSSGTLGSGIGFSISGSTVTFSGTSSLANYESALHLVQYRDTSDAPSTTARVFDVQVDDGAAANNLSAVAHATVTVAAVNDAPVNGIPGAQTFNEDTARTFNSGNGNLISISDADAGSNPVEVTLASTQGLMTLSGTTGLSFTTGDGTSDATMVFTGSIADINTALAGLTYTPTANYSGAAQISLTTDDKGNTGSGGAKTDTDVIALTVAAVNDAPLNAVPGSQSVNEDTALVFNAGNGNQISISDVDAGSSPVQVTLSVAHGTLSLNGTAGLSFTGGDGTADTSMTFTGTTSAINTALNGLTYVGNANYNDTQGAESLSIVTNDQGATGSGGAQQDSDSVSIDVLPVNDAPTAPDVTFNGTNSAIGNTSLVLSDGVAPAAPDPTGPQKTLSGSLLATAGDVDGPGPLVTLAVTNQATSHGHVTITTSGEFSYTPTAGYIGNDTFTYTVSDQYAGGSGPAPGTASGTVTVTVASPKVWYVDATNGSDATGDGSSANPFASLTKLNGVTGDGTTNDDVDGTGDIIFLYGGTYTGGIVLEDGQQLLTKEHGLVVNGTTLEAADGSSVTTINGTVTLASNPATANTIQGVDFGTTTGFALQGTNVGDAKVNTVTAGSINNTTGGAVSVAGSGTGMDLEFASVTSTLSASNALSFNNARGTFNAGSGTLSNAAGNTVDITGDGTNDDLAFSYGGNLSDDGNLLVNITNQTGGTKTFGGTLTDGALAGGGINVGSNTGGTVNFNGQVALNTLTASGVNLASNTGATINFNPGGNGLDITTSSGTGFAATSGGTVTVQGSGNSINSSGATALNLNGVTVAAGGATFASTTSGGGTAGVNLDTVTGTGAINLGTGTLSGHTGAEFDINAGSGAVTYNGTIGNGSGLSVEVTSHTSGALTFNGAINDTNDAGGGIAISGTGGTVDFTNATKTLNTGGSNAVALSNNTGTINFTGGGLDIDTTTGKGFSATASSAGTGTVTIQGSGNTIDTGAATGLEITNTNIGASDLTLQRISSNGAGTGILLNTTGSAGGLHVTGTGSAGTGGTIQNTGQGAVLTSTSEVSLAWMNFTNANTSEGTVNNVDAATFNSAATGAINMSSVTGATLDHLVMDGGVQTGINGQNVSTLTLSNSTVKNFGDEANENDVKLWNLSGTSAITNSTFSFGVGDASAGDSLVDIRNNTGALTLNVTGSTFSNTNDSANGNYGLAVTTVGNGTATVNVKNNDFLEIKTAGVATFARDTSTMNVNITDNGSPGSPVVGTGNTFDPGAGNTGRAIDLNAEDTAHLNFNINRNDLIKGAGGPVINIFGINDAQIQGRIDNNTNMQGGGAGIKGSVINIHPEDSANGIVEVIGNTITNVGNDPGIFAFNHGDGAGPSPDDATLDVTIANNSIAMVGSNTFGIELSSGSDNNDKTIVYGDVSNNAVTVGGSGNDAFGIANTGGGNTFVYLEGFNTNGQTTWNNRGNTPLNSYAELINVNNPSAIPAGHNGGQAIQPTNANALLAAAGGIEAAGAENAGHHDLTQAELDPIVGAAIARWEEAGASDAQVALLNSVHFTVADLPGQWLGASEPGRVAIDTDAAGYGWFVDTTPGDDFEFGYLVGPGRLQTSPTAAPAGDMDLLTVVMHEIGHQLGLEHSLDAGGAMDLMSSQLVTGERRLPETIHDAAGAQAIEEPMLGADQAAALSLVAHAGPVPPVVSADLVQAQMVASEWLYGGL